MASRRSASPIKILFLLLTLTLASPLARSARAASQQAKDSNPDATSQRSLSAMLRQRRSTRPEVGATYESVDDYPSLRSQLPDLIAQAHRDKNLERSLLKMLFDASLQSTLNQLVEQSLEQQAALTPNPARSPEPLVGANELSQQQQQQVNLDRLISEFAVSMVPFAGADLVQPIGQQRLGQPLSRLAPDQQMQTVSPYMDKREYIKPCSFNAVSCVRNPYRKHSSG